MQLVSVNYTERVSSDAYLEENHMIDYFTISERTMKLLFKNLFLNLHL